MSQRPRRDHRFRFACALALCGLGATLVPPASADLPHPPFEQWLAEFKTEAITRGIREDTLARALDGIAPQPVIVERDRTQAEFTLSLSTYLKRRLTAPTIRRARTALGAHRPLLRKVAASYEVDAATMVSIWGLESNFGRFSGVRPTVPALATLAYEPRRAAFFREELFSALHILDRGDVDLPQLKGSWAGAMGQPQFMPSTYLKYAVDFDGDGRRDIWSSPPDIFASIANYLRQHGWGAGERWGRKVRVSAAAAAAIEEAVPMRTTGCRALQELTEPRPLDRWHAFGVRLATGHRLPAGTRSASLLRLDGQAFLVYRNYEALLAYNCAHPYALSVALLADRVAERP